jgi:hypothetical protein
MRLWSVMMLVVGDTSVHSILRRPDVPQHFQSLLLASAYARWNDDSAAPAAMSFHVQMRDGRRDANARDPDSVPWFSNAAKSEERNALSLTSQWSIRFLIVYRCANPTVKQPS